MAAMLSSYTLLSRAPAPVLAPGPKLSPAAVAALQLRKQPAAAVAAVAVPWASGKESWSRRRAPVFVCHAAKYNYKDIQPNVLQSHQTSEFPDWRIMEDKDQLIILKLNVGESTSKDQLKVETTDDQAALVIKYTGDMNDDGGDSPAPANDLDLRLQLPHGCDRKRVKAKMFNGWLVLAIAKPKHDPNQIFFHKGTFYYDANKIAIDD